MSELISTVQYTSVPISTVNFSTRQFSKGPSIIVNISFYMLKAYKRVGGWVAKTSISDNFDMIVFSPDIRILKPNIKWFGL